MTPDLGLAEKLEHILKVKLRVVPSDPKTKLNMSSYKPRGKTLGDLIQFKIKKKEEEK